MTPRISAGDRIPQAELGWLADGAVRQDTLTNLLQGRRAVVVGIPGAFTPVCTCEHIPDLLANVEKLRGAGMHTVICVAPNDPWALDAWAERVDPAGKLLFLSDGNLALARALGVNVVDHKHMLGETSARYMMVVGDGLVHRLTVEPNLMKLTCTRAKNIVFID